MLNNMSQGQEEIQVFEPKNPETTKIVNDLVLFAEANRLEVKDLPIDEDVQYCFGDKYVLYNGHAVIATVENDLSAKSIKERFPRQRAAVQLIANDTGLPIAMIGEFKNLKFEIPTGVMDDIKSMIRLVHISVVDANLALLKVGEVASKITRMKNRLTSWDKRTGMRGAFERLDEATGEA